MGTDIVSFLRNVEPLIRNSQMDCDDIGDIIWDCCEKIEALQADRDKWKALAIHNDEVAQIQAGIHPPIPHYEVSDE